MTRVILRNLWWSTLIFGGLILLGGCTTLPPKSAPVVLPSTLPVRKSVAAVKAQTEKSKVAVEDTQNQIDRAIVLAQQEAQAKSDDERTKAQEQLRIGLEDARKSVEAAATASKEADARADDATREAEVLRASQDKAATNALAQQVENEGLRNQLVASKKLWGLGGVWIGLKLFFEHVILWLAGFAVILTALSFFVPAIGAFVSMVLTNLFKPFTKR